MNKILVFVGGLIMGVAAGVLAMKAGSDEAGEPGKNDGSSADDTDSVSVKESEHDDPSDEEEE